MCRTVVPALALVAAVMLLSLAFAQPTQLEPNAYLPLVQQEGTAAPLSTATPTSTATTTATSIATATATSTATATATTTPSATTTPVPTTLVTNGDFEQGATSWTAVNGAQITSALPSGIVAHSGLFVAVFTGAQNGGGEISHTPHTITAEEPFLSYWVWIEATTPLCSSLSGDRGGVAVFLVNTNNYRLDEFLVCGGTATQGWVRRTMDLRDYIGSTVRIDVIVYAPSAGSAVYIDDIGFQAAP